VLTAPTATHTQDLLGAVPGQRFAAELATASTAPAAAAAVTGPVARQEG